VTTVYDTEQPIRTVDAVGGLVAAPTPPVGVVNGVLHINGQPVHPCCLEDLNSGFCRCPALVVDEPAAGFPAPITTPVTFRGGVR
jgi:hypothetical protein